MFKSKKMVSILLVVLLVSMVFVGCNSENKNGNDNTDKVDDTKTYNFKVSTNHPEDHPMTDALKEFSRLLNEKTDGAVEVDVYPAAQLGEEEEVIEQAQNGMLEFVRVSAGNLSGFEPMMDIFSVPYLFRDADHYWDVLNGEIGQEIFDYLEDNNLKGIVYYDGGARSIYNSVKPINNPEDLVGMKIRVMPSQTMIDTIEAFKAIPTTTTFAEVYSALQTNVIDGAENSAISLLTMNHYEVAKYFSLNEHMRIPDMLIMSLDIWNELPKDIQDAIMEAAEESQVYQRQAWSEFEEETLKTLVEKGVEINEVDQSKFAEVVSPLVESLKPNFNGVIEKIQSMD